MLKNSVLLSYIRNEQISFELKSTIPSGLAMMKGYFSSYICVCVTQHVSIELQASDKLLSLDSAL